jgi:4-methyl-5(b-hydroxyethyl)-thiazole monophosphate biosynthesis
MNGLMILSDQMEDVESLATKALLTRAGFHISTLNLQGKNVVTAHYGTTVEVDFTAIDAIDAFDFLIIPGGAYVAQTVDQDTKIKALAKAFHQQGKWIAAICAGPRFLLQENLIEGNYTAYPGSEKDAKKGHYLPFEKAVIDFPFITARSAGSVYEFVFAILQTFQGDEALATFKDQIKY